MGSEGNGAGASFSKVSFRRDPSITPVLANERDARSRRSSRALDFTRHGEPMQAFY